jgi:hypothetical protein
MCISCETAQKKEATTPYGESPRALIIGSIAITSIAIRWQAGQKRPPASHTLQIAQAILYELRYTNFTYSVKEHVDFCNESVQEAEGQRTVRINDQRRICYVLKQFTA